MRRSRVLLTVLILLISLPALSFAREIDPIVDSVWLEKNLSNSKLVVVDIRKVEDYKAGHVPGAVNVIQASWVAARDGLRNEVPMADDLGDLISDAGIKADSWVVLVGPDFGTFVWITRVAWTLLYAGVENVAILDGGHAKWVKDGKALSSDAVRAKSSGFKVKFNPNYITTKDYVISRIGKGLILDTRGPDAYFGIAKVPFVTQFGHIPGAKSLPSVWIVNADGVARSKAELEAMAAGMFKDKSAEIITYCDTGVFCSGWWFVMSEMLGYRNMKSYDGSSEEIAKDPRVTFVKYIWE
jgi:thiosulfate/3-mercaptopyruvate sulfurtransferase